MPVTKRKALPLRWALLLIRRQGGVCAVNDCDTLLLIGPRGQHLNFIDEHIIPLAIGGTNALKNRELRCCTCAKTKTLVARYGSIDSDLRLITKTRKARTEKFKVKRKPRRTAFQRKHGK